MLKKSFLTAMVILFILSVKLYAHVELTYPEGGETFYAGDTVTITWVQVQAHDLQNWELYYSPDGADTWEVISNNIPASLREYDWVVPAEETVMGRIRVVQNNADTDFQDVSNNIRIVDVTGFVESKNEISANSIAASPNPFIRKTKISFTIYKKTNVSLDILQSNGKKMATLINEILPPDEYLIDWNPAFVSSETYLGVLTVGNKRKVIKLQQLRP